MNGDRAMSYGHAERNLSLIRQLEAETSRMLASLDQPIPEQPAWLQESAAAAAADERHPGPYPVTPSPDQLRPSDHGRLTPVSVN